MITLTRLNAIEFYLNPDHIELIEETPDTVISLSNGKKFVVLEKADEIVDKIVEHRRRIFYDVDIIKKTTVTEVN